MLQLVGLFAGFTSVAFAVYVAMSGKGIKRLRDRVGHELLRIWVCALIVPWLCAFTIVVAKIMDRGPDGGPNAWVVVIGAIVVVTLQLTRTAWLFTQLALIELKGTTPAMPTTGRPLSVVQRTAP